MATADELTEVLDRLRLRIEHYRSVYGSDHPIMVAAVKAWLSINDERQQLSRAE